MKFDRGRGATVTNVRRQCRLIYLVTVLMLPLAGVTVTAQSDTDAQFSMPHTAWGHPDLQGTWTMETFTPLQRPEHLGDKAFYSEEELEELRELLTAEGVDPLAGNVLAIEDEQEREERLFQTNRDDTYVHYDNELWLRGNTPKGLSSNRTSLIVDPPNGQLPARTEEAAMGVATRREARTGREFDSLEMRPMQERCVVWSHEGPPMLPPPYNDLMHIMQTPDYVAFVPELRTNQPRLVPLDGGSHISSKIEQFSGDSRGRWEGDTLVVETTNFTDKTRFQGVATSAMHVEERFTRDGDGTIRYEFTVTDSDAWTAPWSVEVPMMMRDETMYEYACHEGNHDIGNVLLIYRNLEKQAAAEGR